jgi:hypothetical protein
MNQEEEEEEEKKGEDKWYKLIRKMKFSYNKI